ncbi:MAG TPA: GTPase Era [Candidatus Agrococcus pullicola]|uniref:GTPase Era n=1 Tax=Candidatus Agrococcus pullicola TaxID=2838429 RepID=A0A9D2C9L6_9MICO|nr:GTPase Era [Candidatus Agrococcus pullicola]
MTFKAGLITFVGRPNAGKSTLTNAILGEKIAITSSKPQTTRRTIRGILTREHDQIVIVDTPGMHRPRTLLGQRLNSMVRETIADVDVVCLCIPADEEIGPGDRFIDNEVGTNERAKKIAVVTKSDRVKPARLAQQLTEVAALREWDAVIPVSATKGEQVAELVDVIADLLPESPKLYPDEQVTEEVTSDRIAELIREASLEEARDELPHSIIVTVDDMIERDDGLIEIFANLWVERDSQKGIVIGSGGARIRQIGQDARAEIEELVNARVHLDLRVKIAKEWQGDAKQLRRFGY